MIEFAIVGAGGWRAAFYFRIAAELPDRFRVVGGVAHHEEKARATAETWNVPVYTTIDELLSRTSPSFVVNSVSAPAKVSVLRELVERGMPVLSETPPAEDADEMNGLADLFRPDARIQIAEQYIFQPIQAARLRIARSGLLGDVAQAQISVAHGYHGMSLIRAFLGVTFEEAEITAATFESKLIAGPGRKGPPSEEKISNSVQEVAWLRFGEKLGVYDFAGGQYSSWIRSSRFLVRGERGEINGDEVRYLKDFLTPIHYRLIREYAGEDANLEGWHLKGILGGQEWVYRNPFAPGRLSGDEVAVAACLEKMAAYAAGGPSFYSLAEGCQDHYLGLKVAEAVASGTKVSTTRQSWAND